MTHADNLGITSKGELLGFWVADGTFCHISLKANSYSSISLSSAGLILRNRAAALDVDKGFL